MLIIPAAILRDMTLHGEEGFPEEIVGILVGRDEGDNRIVTESIRVENTKEENRKRRYTIDPLTLAKIEREKSVIGFYHSHPDHPAQPSQTDLEWAWPFYSYVIQSVMNGKAATRTSWRLEDDRKNFIEEKITES